MAFLGTGISECTGCGISVEGSVEEGVEIGLDVVEIAQSEAGFLLTHLAK